MSHGPFHGKVVRTDPEQAHLPVRYLTAVATGGEGLGRLKVLFLDFKYLSAPFTDGMLMVPERGLLIPRNPVAKLNLTQHFRFAKECRRPVNRGNRCRRIVSLDFLLYFGNGYMPFPFEKMVHNRILCDVLLHPLFFKGSAIVFD